MFNNINQSYNGTDATLEIVIMLTVAFLLGYVLRYLWERLYSSKQPVLEQKTLFDSNGGEGGSGSVFDYSVDDLKIVEGIGPKIESLLKEAGITDLQRLKESSPEELKQILKSAGERFAFHDPTTWPEQASLALDGKWSELEEYQDFLKGGRM